MRIVMPDPDLFDPSQSLGAQPRWKQLLYLIEIALPEGTFGFASFALGAVSMYVVLKIFG
jgi:hypothetical protein